MKNIIMFLSAVAVLTCTFSCKPVNENYMPHVLQYNVVCKEVGKYFGWPANNGLWVWDNNEILVGFTKGNFVI
jgi:hypothetical protein